MTLQALQVHLTYAKQPCVRRAMWCVTTAATFRFYRHVFVNKRTSLVRVTRNARCVSTGNCPDLAKCCGSMNVVAVAAFNEALVHAMVIRLSKIAFGCGMALVAEHRLFLDEQMLCLLGMMRRMTIEAADLTVCMSRT